MEIPVNKYQTEITEDLLESLPKEVQEGLIDTIHNIEFVRWLISPNRGYARNRPRDKDGKIIVDLAHPHILEDMDYFRPSALHYEEYGTYTNLRPNSNPNSEYGKWLRQERDRCWNGYVRESDGEWVTGPMYFYFNYGRMIISKIRKGTKQADRIETFPEVWEGVYWRFHYMDQARNGGMYNDYQGGNHCAELAARGKSKSYSMASILGRNFILGENRLSHKKVLSAAVAYQKEFLTKDGVISKFLGIIDFCATNTQFPRRRLRDSISDMTWIMGYKDTESGTDFGTNNSVLGVSIKDDASKIRGKRASYIGIEEFGSAPNLLTLYNVLLPSVQEGEYTFGLLYLQGTAAEDASDFSGAQEIMYNPRGYNMYALPNVYDKINQGKPEFIFFFPGYINRKGCYNKDGVSDVVQAIIEILLARYRVKYNTADPKTLLRTIAETPITPAEAIIKVGVNMFPVTDLTERLLQLDSNPSEYDDVYTGELIINNSGEVEYKMTSAQPIRDFPHKDNKIAGAIEIFQMPEIDKNSGKVFSNRYITGADPYDDDNSNTMSLGSIFVLDLWTDKIVAEYTGRPTYADDFYEICRRLTMFYNGSLLYENNKKGLFAYFSSNSSIHLLADQPDFLLDKQLVKDTGFGNKRKGVNATAPINAYARSLLRDWLIQPVVTTVKQGDEEIEVTVPNLFFIRNRALIKELIGYNTAGNFDRISAMGMLMLHRQDKMILCQGNPKQGIETRDADYLGNDPFFSRNYKSIDY